LESLDYETRTHHYLRLQVVFEEGIKDQTTVIIEVRDDNDVRPDLYVQPSLSRLTTNTPVNTFVSLVTVDDIDTEESYSYSILSGDRQNPIFRIEPSGLIKTQRCITDADINLYELNVQVDDSKHKATRIVTVRIYRAEARSFDGNCGLDCREFGNPSAYVFEEGLYTKTIQEGTPANAFIAQARVPAFDNATYSLSPEAIGLFTVDSNGTITSLTAFDYEKQPYYSFKVKAALPTTVRPIIAEMESAVIVTIENIDDSPPVLASVPTKVSISELTVPNAPIGCIKVIDKDTNPSNLLYSLTNNNQGLFKVDQNGEVRVNYSLKANVGQNLTIGFEVSDGKNQPLSGSFFIIVVDENDEIPIFEKIVYDASLSETSPVDTTVVTVKANDADRESQIKYSLVEASTVFQINQDTGVITLKSQMDYEVAQVHEFLVSATDRMISSTCIVKVVVIDANDTAPLLSQSLVNGKISEYALIGAKVAQVLASDPDTTDVLTYTLNQPSSIFQLEPSTGGLTLKDNLYKFKETEYDLPFTVKDSQNNAVEGTLRLQVQRSTINPCPDFQGGHTIELAENANVGIEITSLRNPTQDYYSLLIYSVSDDSGDNKFSIDLDGRVTLAKPLDYEQQSLYTITVDSYDTVRKFNSTVIFFVKVLDINESPPVITTSSMAVSELADIGTAVGEVEVTDADGTSTATFSFNANNNPDSAAFFIDINTGVITVNTRFNSGVKSSYNVNVCANDGQRQGCKDIIVSVSNENDRLPKFVKQAELFTIHDPKVGSVIGTITASDDDGNTLTYNIVDQGNPDIQKHFTIDNNTGVITVVEVPTSERYSLVVCASDGKLENCLLVTVVVPSSTPIFSPAVYGVAIPGNKPVGDQVIRVYATDVTGNSNIEYFITSGNADGKFAIDTVTGVITVAKLPSTLIIYDLIVQAKNKRHGNFSEAPVTIVMSSASFIVNQPIQQEPLTSGAVNFSLVRYNLTRVLHFLVIGQEINENSPTVIDHHPVSWYQATTDLGYKYYEYYADKITRDDINNFGATRKRREVCISHT